MSNVKNLLCHIQLSLNFKILSLYDVCLHACSCVSVCLCVCVCVCERERERKILQVVNCDIPLFCLIYSTTGVIQILKLANQSHKKQFFC